MSQVPRCTSRQTSDGVAGDQPGVSGHEHDRLGRHRSAIDRSVGWAEAAAARGDYYDALGWLAVVEAVGPPLTAQQLGLRRTWLTRMAGDAPGGRDQGPRSP